MQVSSNRLNALKAALAVTILVGLFWGIGGFFFTESIHKATAPAGEPFTNSVEVMGKWVGAAIIAWVVAAGLVLRNVLGNLGLLKAVTIAVGILTVVGFYVALVVAERTTALDWVSNVLMLLVFVALLVLYPRGQQVG